MPVYGMSGQDVLYGWLGGQREERSEWDPAARHGPAETNRTHRGSCQHRPLLARCKSNTPSDIQPYISTVAESPGQTPG